MSALVFRPTPSATRFSSAIVNARLDLVDFLTFNGHAPPAYFCDKAFGAWIDVERARLSISTHHARAEAVPLTRRQLGARSKSEAAQVFGTLVRNGVLLRYHQIWVRANYSGYSRCFRDLPSKQSQAELPGLAELHAGHVVNRASLREHPEAWVLLIPVFNLMTGHAEKAIDTHLPGMSSGLDTGLLGPLAAFKLFSSRAPETLDQLREQMTQVRSWFSPPTSRPVTPFALSHGDIVPTPSMPSWFLPNMERDVRAALLL